MSKITKKWSTATIIEFLGLYKKYPCLWDYKHPSYKDKNQRNDALRRIVEVMSETVRGFDVNGARAKIRSIRNAYTLEQHKIINSYQSGASLDAIYTPTVGWFSVADEFLRDIVETRNTRIIVNIDDIRQRSDLNNDTDKDDTSQLDKCLLQSPGSPIINMLSKKSEKLPTKTMLLKQNEEPPFKRAKPNNHIEEHSNAKRISKHASQKVTSQVTDDEFDVFGKIVAVHLRQLPLHAALHCQTDILQYLVQNRLEVRVALPHIQRDE
ncbi:hypothetical protein ABEB36_006010 [Hypothenemus hampei]|uniref:MADF domain-containing protein n=1 Tax=Hypothenemus hampei TaxID=57062 RepID=A0ABD1F069_HYPHA